MTDNNDHKTELPAGWIKCYLGDILFVKNGYAFKSSRYLEDGIPVIRISDIQDGRVTTGSAKKITFSDEYEDFVIQKNDILIAMSGATTGKFGVFAEDAFAYQNQRVGNLRLYNRELIDKKFIFYLLGNLQRQIEKDAYGGAQPNISGKKIEELQLPLPPFAEQHRIVAKIEELFSDLDHSVAALERAKAQLKIYRQAVLKHAFEGKLTEQWRAARTDVAMQRLDATDLLAQIQTEREARYRQQLTDWQAALKEWESQGKRGRKPAKPKKPKELPPLTEAELAELPSLPEGWGWTYFDFLGDWKGGGTPSKSKSEYWEGGGILWISPKDMKSQYIVDTQDKITELGVENSSAKYIAKNSVLFVVRSGILRRTLPVAVTTKLSTVNQDLQAITPIIVNPEYLYWYAVSEEFNIRHVCAKSGTTVESIETTLLKNYKISICSLPEQHAIVAEIEARLSIVDNLEATIETALEQAGALRQSILKQAFAGKLVPQDPSDEPASVLLERIAKPKP